MTTIFSLRTKVFFSIFLLVSIIVKAQTDYYYFQGEKIYLTKNYEFINIVTTQDFDENSLSTMEVEAFNMYSETELRI